MPVPISPVDSVEITVLVDNATDSLSSVPGFVRHEWPGLVRAGMRELSGECQCCANHGLALVVTARRGDVARTMLFDTGPAGYAVEWNGARLGVEFGAIGAVTLSHGHWDHAGGMIAALKLITASNGGRKVPCFLHPGMFRQRAMTLADGSILPIAPIATPDELAALGAEIVMTAGPVAALEGMFRVSGEIPRVTAYERGFPGHLRRTADGRSWEPDPLILDERFLALDVRGKGIVLFTACSHAGVVNVLRHAAESFAPTPIHAVFGGFHLAGGNEKIIPETVRDLASFDLALIAPGHCTGWRATAALAAAYGDRRVVPLAVGRTFAL